MLLQLTFNKLNTIYERSLVPAVDLHLHHLLRNSLLFRLGLFVLFSRLFFRGGKTAVRKNQAPGSYVPCSFTLTRYI